MSKQSAPKVSQYPNTAPTKAAEPIHGFNLNEGEAFSSTRYFSQDKKSFAQIIAKNGEFTATHQNLNDEHKNDLALEMSYQFLLNLPPDKKNAHLSGPPEMVHKMHAALLYLQKEAGARFADVKFHLPQGMSVAPEEINDAYIKKHLGDMNKPPHQVVQWRDFVKMELNTPKNVVDTPPAPTPKEEHAPLIDMERVFKAEGLSQQDKRDLNEYQRYLKDVWIDGIKELKGRAGDSQLLIDAHEEFVQRTESALRIFQKSPSLAKEVEALTTLYVKETESHQKMLEELYQNDSDYETQMKELLPKLQKAQREALEDCIHCLSEHLEMEFRHTPMFEKERYSNLQNHLNTIQEIKSLVEGEEKLSDEMLRSFGSQMAHALKDLESIRDSYSKSPLFQQMKDFSQDLSQKKTSITKTATEQLKQAGNNVKERLQLFKKEFMPPKAAEPVESFALSILQKNQLKLISCKLNRIKEPVETEEGQSSLEQLAKKVQELSAAPSVSKEHIEELHQCIDKATPHIKDNHGLIQVLFEIKISTSASLKSTPTPEHQESKEQAHQSPGLTMP